MPTMTLESLQQAPRHKARRANGLGSKAAEWAESKSRVLETQFETVARERDVRAARSRQDSDREAGERGIGRKTSK
jgi:hypothetical protein